MKTKLKWAVSTAAVIAGLSAAFLAGTSRAAGIPPTGALSYSGLLQDTGGTSLAGPQFVEVKFWNDPSLTGTSNLLCDSGTPASVALVGGHFTLVLPDTCTTAVAGNSNVYAEVLVGSSAASATSLGRSKLGAVPYAVSADAAVRATTATVADGALFANAVTAKTRPYADIAQPNPTAGTQYTFQSGSTVVVLGTTGTARILFPTPFPTGLVTVVGTDSYAHNQQVKGFDDDQDVTGFTVLGTVGARVRVNWIAMGW